MKIKWKSIKHYPLYLINNYGNIVEKKHTTVSKHHISQHKLHPSLHDDRYLVVALFNKYGRKTLRVHRLVATAFIPNPHKYPYVNHKNCIRTDNKVSNLEWCTPKYNRRYKLCQLKYDVTELGKASIHKEIMSNYDYKLAKQIQYLARQTTIYKNRLRNHK